MQNFASVKDNYKLQQRSKKPEVGVTGDRQVQNPVRPDNLDLLLEVTENIELEFPGRVGRGNAGYPEARREAKQRACAKDQSADCLSPMKALSQQWADHRTRNNGQKRCQFKDPVAPGQQFVRQKFRKQSIF